MESKLIFLLHLGIVLMAAKVGGVISKRLKQPAVLGQIIVGIVLGFILKKTDTISHMSEIGVVFLMFIAGLETDVNELKASGKSSSMIALGGVVVPLAMVAIGIYLFTGNLLQSIFMGVIASATSVSISVQTLREIGKMRTKQGIGILGAAIIDDVVGIILLTLVVGLKSPGENGNICLVMAKISGFFVLTFIVGFIIIKVIKGCFNCERNELDEHVLVISIVLCFIMAYISEELGVAAITGAYFAGVIISMTDYRHKISHEISRISYAIFIPIFFVSIGLGVDIKAALSAVSLGVVLIVLASVGKIIGCGFGARISGFSKIQSLQIGVGMVPRAEVAIIIANLGLSLDIITHAHLAAVLLMVITTTLLTPSMLKRTFSKEDVNKDSALAK